MIRQAFRLFGTEKRRPAQKPAIDRLEYELRRGVAQPGSASGLGPEGRRFESFRPDHSCHEKSSLGGLFLLLPVAQLDRATAF